MKLKALALRLTTFVRKLRPRTVALIGGALVVALVTAGVLLWPHPQTAPTLRGAAHHGHTPKPSASTSQAPAVAYVAATPAAIAALPEAMYKAVIPGLLPYASDVVPVAAGAAYSIAADVALYGADKTTPVARFAHLSFLQTPTVIVPVEIDGDWALVLTPARRALPSTSGGVAAAQTAGWVRRDLLKLGESLPNHISISAGKQTLAIEDQMGTILHSFDIGVGMNDTPTPTGVLGYIQARYLDPSQGQAVHPIQLTSLHSAAADEPYLGKDGGLIGIHYFSVSRGTISHGCLRLDAKAITAVNALPVGTPVLITP